MLFVGNRVRLRLLFKKRRGGTLVEVAILKVESRLLGIEQSARGARFVVFRPFSIVTVICIVAGSRMSFLLRKVGASRVPANLQT